MKITESRLRALIESCVKEALKGELEEGLGWDVYKSQVKGHDETRYPSWESLKDIIDGDPDEEAFKRYKERYDAAKKGELYEPDKYERLDGFDGMAYDYADKAIMTEPGLKGKLRRGALAAAATAGITKNKVKKGISNLGKKKRKKSNDDFDSFTM